MQSTNLRRGDSCQESGLLWIYLRVIRYSSFSVSEVRITSSCIITHPSVLADFQSASYRKIYRVNPKGDNTKQVKWCSHACKCNHTLHCLSVCLVLSPSTHTHSHTVTEMSIVRSDPAAVCDAVYGPASF